MPKNLTIEDKTRTIDPWIDGAVEEFFEFNNNPDISLIFLKKLALSVVPKALLEEEKIFEEAEGVYPFADAFNNPAQTLLNDSVDVEFNPQIIYLARARLIEAVLKKMHEFKNVDLNWVIEAQTTLADEYAQLKYKTITTKVKINNSYNNMMLWFITAYLIFDSALDVYKAYNNPGDTIYDPTPNIASKLILGGMLNFTRFLSVSNTSTIVTTHLLPEQKIGSEAVLQNVQPKVNLNAGYIDYHFNHIELANTFLKWLEHKNSLSHYDARFSIKEVKMSKQQIDYVIRLKAGEYVALFGTESFDELVNANSDVRVGDEVVDVKNSNDSRQILLNLKLDIQNKPEWFVKNWLGTMYKTQELPTLAREIVNLVENAEVKEANAEVWAEIFIKVQQKLNHAIHHPSSNRTGNTQSFYRELYEKFFGHKFEVTKMNKPGSSNL